MANILIADDDADARELLRFTLTSLGHNVTAVGNGQGALLSARSSPPEIIFSDILMPEMDGFDLCREIKADARLKTIPVVFYTATYVTPEDEQLAMDLGASGFIRKATDAARFVEIIKETLHRHERHAGPAVIAPLDELAYRIKRDEVVSNKLNDKIIELEEVNQKLRISEEKYRNIFESLQDVYVETTVDGTMLEVSSGIATFTGNQYLREELIGANIETFFQDVLVRADMLRVLQNKGHVYDFEAMMINKEGTLIPCSISALLIKGNKGGEDRVACMFRDITERKANEDKLSYLAKYDSLTDLPNRLLIKDRLEQAIIEARRHDRLVGVALLDLDRFKSINDTIGHLAGDHVLREVGKRLTTVLRDSDTISRVSGDEFAIVLADMSHEDDVIQVLGKITSIYNHPIIFDGHELLLSASIGITVYPIDQGSAEELLRNADIAMYKAKENGGNNYQFYTEIMTVIAQEKFTLEAALQHAVERDELVLYYQPQVNLETREITGMEALLRWNHPELGLVSPAKFIPLAEETGLILPIGEWVLRTAVQQMKQWQTQGFSSLRVAVNISSRQFRESNIYAVVGNALSDYSLDASYLELELTESMLLKNIDQTTQTLNSLKKIGIQFSIDDFGTGYSSLSYLRKFPVSVLKIDQSFVRDINKDTGANSIVKTIIKMAHTLDMKVVAEGVETHEQLLFLSDNNCDSIQGYYFSKAVPANEFTSMLRSKKCLSMS